MQDKELLKDLLIYLDTQLNFEHHIYLDNEFLKSVKLIGGLQEKHPEFVKVKSRHELIKKILEELWNTLERKMEKSMKKAKFLS